MLDTTERRSKVWNYGIQRKYITKIQWIFFMKLRNNPAHNRCCPEDFIHVQMKNHFKMVEYFVEEAIYLTIIHL